MEEREGGYRMFDPDDNADDFAEMVGLSGSFSQWLEKNSDLDSICEEFLLVLSGIGSQSELVDKLNNLADRAVADGYAGRRLGFVQRNRDKVAVEVCTHPETQRRVVQFMIEHMRECDDEECEMPGEAHELIGQGLDILPVLVEEGLWTNNERLMMVGMLDQLQAEVRNATA